MGLGLLIAAGSLSGASLAKGGDGDGNGGGQGAQGNGGGNGNGDGGGQGAQGNGGGNGNGNGGGQAGGGGPAGGGSSGGGPQAGGQEGPASNRMLDRAVVALNAAYAVPRPPARLTRDENIRQMATYDRMMLSALQMPADTPEQQDARDRAIADARIQLAAATHRRLNPAAVSRIDALLGLPATDPHLGVW